MMRRILRYMAGARRGWILTLECGHTRFQDTVPIQSTAYCDACAKGKHHA